MGGKILLYISYRGDGFCGYQAQHNGPSVQGALNAATEMLFGHPCDITGCSRTDSGVHARMFCATVTDHRCTTLTTTIPSEKIPRALSIRLPDSISVWRAQWVPETFHPRYDVSSKAYIYRFLCAPERDPFETGRSWLLPVPARADMLSDMQMAAAGMIGQRDFSACMDAGSTVVNKVRHVMQAEVFRDALDERILTFRVRADGFLYHMVRIMAGTLCEVAAGRIPPDSIPRRLDSLDRHLMGQTAPACGLYLDRVYYDRPDHPGYYGGDMHG